MEAYNFDKEISRYNTNSLKYDFAVELGRPADVLPMWIADMDFRASQPVLDAGHIFGKKSESFQRMVLACTRKTLERALTQLEAAVHQR